MKDYKQFKKNLIIAIVIVVVAVASGIYIGSQDSRNAINKAIFRNETSQSECPQIVLENAKNSSVYAYGNKVAILEGNNLNIYNQEGKKEKSIEVALNQPKAAIAGNYLLLGDSNGSNVYLIQNTDLKWSKTIDGHVSIASVNTAGIAGISVSDTTYRSVIIMYDYSGKELFKYFLSKTTVTSLDISNDGKYLSFVEVETPGMSVVSRVKTISVDKAKKEPENAIMHTYETKDNVLIIAIRHDEEKVVVFKDNGIYICKNGNEEKLTDLPENSGFAGIDLKDHCYKLDENSNGRNSIITIFNTDNKSGRTYEIEDAVINISTMKDMLAINVGSKVLFINSSARPVKRYLTNENISKILLGDSIAAIIYNDTISIVKI